MEEMPKRYEPKEAENKWKTTWEENQTYAYEEDENKEVFSIDTPPPTVSGKMHIGHSFSYTHQDIIARFHRMNGKSVFYPFGTDDNGLPTDKLVEKTKGVKSKKMQRTDYLDLAMTTVKELLPEFADDWKKLGMSCDFKQSYSTISKETQKTSQKAFIELFKKQKLYRKETPVSWCPVCQTAIAQAEFENVEMASTFNDIIFKSKGEDLIIATTRPELLPSCVALFYNPEDERYQKLKGTFAQVPLFNYDVPILADESVDKEKGTGLMMCCTFGDKEDIEKWHKHKLPLKVSFTRDGKMNENAQKYEGIPIKEARKKILTDLEETNLLIAKKKIKHAVNVHERCGTEVEFMNTFQWFINVLDHKQELINAADDIEWHPEHMKTRYVHWVENLGWDWCVSRQRYFGIPIPIWYTKEGEVITPNEDELPVDPTNGYKPKGYEDKELIPEMDVLDTWATSSISPQIAHKWVNNPKEFKKKTPMTVRPQAHDIIRTWAFYTITRGLYHQGVVPWNNIMISGFVLDPKGNKMSKSKGNVIVPQEVVDKYSADALRFWAAGSKLGDDLPYMEKDVKTGQKTVTKLWNACKFSMMQLEDYKGEQPEQLHPSDVWLLSKLQDVIGESTKAYEDYEYSRAKIAIDNFFWNTFCDYYLEIIKDRMYNPEKRGVEGKISAQYTLTQALNTILKLFAPIMPFITEELYHYLHPSMKEEESLHTATWPHVDAQLKHDDIEIAGDLQVALINAARKAKSEASRSLRNPIESFVITCDEATKKSLQLVLDDIQAATNTQELTFGEGGTIDVKEGLNVSITLGEAEKKE